MVNSIQFIDTLPLQNMNSNQVLLYGLEDPGPWVLGNAHKRFGSRALLMVVVECAYVGMKCPFSWVGRACTFC